MGVGSAPSALTISKCEHLNPFFHWNLILWYSKHILSHYDGSQKCNFHALYASTIPLSHHFVTEQQQKYPFFYVFPRLSWVALIICPITCRNLYNVNVDLSEKQQLFLSRFRQIYKIIISKGTRDLTTEADSLTTHGMRKHSATTLSDETRNFIRYWDFLRLKSFETDAETFFETEYFEDWYLAFFKTKIFRDRYWDSFLRPNFFDTDTCWNLDFWALCCSPGWMGQTERTP